MSAARSKPARRNLSRLLQPVGSTRKKSRLRRELMQRPVTPDCPFDPEAKLLRSIGVKPAMLDVGANTGKYSTVLEDVVGAGNLYLFEPLPQLATQLRRKFRKSHVYNVALSESDGVQRIRVPYIDGKRFDTRATLSSYTEPGSTGSEDVQVQVCTLDGMADDLPLDAVGFIKIDVEGHEHAVLEGATQTIARSRPLLLIEIEARHHAFPITDIFSKVGGLGYRGYYVDPAALALYPTSRFDVQRDQNQEDLVARRFGRYLNNFFFVPEEQERDFVTRAVEFLDAEKPLVRGARRGG